MSHSTPPDDPTELLKAFFRHIEAHLDENNPLSDADAKAALKKGLAALTASEESPDIAVIDGGLSSEPSEVHQPRSHAPELAVHSKIETDEDDSDNSGAISLADFKLDKGPQLSVHIVNADDVNSLFNQRSVERGQILLSEEQPSQTIFFGKVSRHVRIYCRAGAFEVGTDDGPIGHLFQGQSIDVEAPCIFVSWSAESSEGTASVDALIEGDYVMLDSAGLEW